MTANLSDTAVALLSQAAQRDDHLAITPLKLSLAARNAVAKSLLTRGLVEETNVVEILHVWRRDEGGLSIGLRLNEEGFRALGLKPAAHIGNGLGSHLLPVQGIEVTNVDCSPSTLRKAAVALLGAWDNAQFQNNPIMKALSDPIANLRSATNTGPSRDAVRLIKSQEGTKKGRVIAMLRRIGGASGSEVSEMTGWNSNTVRGFLAGLKKNGFAVSGIKQRNALGQDHKCSNAAVTRYMISEV